MITRINNQEGNKESNIRVWVISFLMLMLIAAHISYLLDSERVFNVCIAAFFSVVFYFFLMATAVRKNEDRKIGKDISKLKLNSLSCAGRFRTSASAFHIVALILLSIFSIITFFQFDEPLLSGLMLISSAGTLVVAKSAKLSDLLYSEISKTLQRIFDFFTRKVLLSFFINIIKEKKQDFQYIQSTLERPPRYILS